jgi:hypothetical protein
MAGFNINDLSPKILRNITKDISRDAEKIMRDKLNSRISEMDGNQHIELDIRHMFRISKGKAEIDFNLSYEKIQGEQRERIRGYSYLNKNGKTVNVQAHNRVNRDTHTFQTENGDYTTSSEIPDEVFEEVFADAVQEAASNALDTLKIK